MTAISTSVTGMPKLTEALSKMDLAAIELFMASYRFEMSAAKVQDQLELVNNTKDRINNLNGVLSAVNAAIKSISGNDSQSQSIQPNSAAWNAINSAFADAGLPHPLNSETTKDQLLELTVTVKDQLDSINSSFQMDMLRLQVLSSKHNEAIDTLANSKSRSNQNSDILTRFPS